VLVSSLRRSGSLLLCGVAFTSFTEFHFGLDAVIRARGSQAVLSCIIASYQSFLAACRSYLCFGRRLGNADAAQQLHGVVPHKLVMIPPPPCVQSLLTR